MEKKTLALVSYSNTLPFAKGIEQSDYFQNQWQVKKFWPSLCFEKFRDREVDLGLLPVASNLFLNKHHYILGDYGIACEGEVYTVGVLSHLPIHELDTIYLDYQSRTSVLLVQVLAKFHWKIDAKFKQGDEGFENRVGEKEGILLIGDRVFKERKNYKHFYDLGKEWYDFTGLPFVFAAWFSWENDPVLAKELNFAGEAGVSSIPIIANNNDMLLNYLKNHILYQFNSKTKEGLNRYLELANTVLAK